MNGRELADEAVCRWPGLRVLSRRAIRATPSSIMQDRTAGVHMIGKPFSFGELSAKVGVLLDSDALAMSVVGVRTWKGGCFQWVQVHPANAPAEATGAAMEVTKWLKPSDRRHEW